MATSNLTLNELQNTLDNNSTVVIDFWASWCGPCRTFGPVFEKVSDKHPDVKFMKVDTEKEQQLAALFQVSSIPTLAIFRDGILLYREPGALQEAGLENLLDQVKKLDMEKVKAEMEKEHAEHSDAHDCENCGHHC
jgi:thioredoxin